MHKLEIELVPQTSWFTNLRSLLMPQEWDRVRHEVYARANYHCECCGAKVAKGQLDAHEEWAYHDDGRQELVRLVALCKACHECKHIGLAQVQGRFEIALAHLMQVNRLSADQARQQVDAAFTLWEKRGRRKWSLDTEYLKRWWNEKPAAPAAGAEGKPAPSPQQIAIYDAVLQTTDSLIIQATAGAGKTSVLVGSVERMRDAGVNLGDVLFVAFNKAIVQELQERLPEGVKASTMHAFGMAILRENLGQLKVENYKYSNIAKDLLEDEGFMPRRHPDYRLIADSVRDLLNDVRIGIHPFEDAEALRHLLLDTQPDAPEKYLDVIVAVVRAALHKGIKVAERRGEIDFTDMLWLPWKLDLTPKTRYQTVLLDEAQDQSPLQRWLSLKAIRPGGRIIAVGDREQAIYGFMGASPDSMNLLKAATGARELPLSVTWRCPRSHVALAQAVVGEASIQAAPGAAEGEAAVLSQDRYAERVKEGDVILARTNRPLIEEAFRLIKEGRRAKIRGRDIGQGLIKTAEVVQKEYAGREFTLSGFLQGLSEYAAEKAAAIEERGDLNPEQRAQRSAEVHDRAAVLGLIAENARAASLEDLKVAIGALFDDNLGDFILLSTVHKAKGLEFNTVFLLDAKNIPAPFARSPEELQGERCVLFVALTRAKKHLYFIDSLPNHPGVRALMERRAESAA